jgi:hypothetical protein
MKIGNDYAAAVRTVIFFAPQVSETQPVDRNTHSPILPVRLRVGGVFL